MVDTARMAAVASTDDTTDTAAVAHMDDMPDTAHMDDTGAAVAAAVEGMGDGTAARTDDTAAVEGMPGDGTVAEGTPVDGTAVGAGMPVGGTPADDTEYMVMA